MPLTLHVADERGHSWRKGTGFGPPLTVAAVIFDYLQSFVADVNKSSL